MASKKDIEARIDALSKSHESEHLAILSEVGMPVVALNQEMQTRLASLSSAEVKALASIKARLNEGLGPRELAAADTVGGFVW